MSFASFLIRLCHSCHSCIKLASPRIWASTSWSNTQAIQRPHARFLGNAARAPRASNPETAETKKISTRINEIFTFHKGPVNQKCMYLLDAGDIMLKTPSNTNQLRAWYLFCSFWDFHSLLLVSIHPRLVSKTNHNFQRLPFQALRKLLLLWRRGRRWLHTLTLTWSRFELQKIGKIRKFFKVLVKILSANQVNLFFYKIPGGFFCRSSEGRNQTESRP